MSDFVAEKDPDAILDYKLNWAEWLDGDTISSSAWTAENGIVITASSTTNQVATVWLSGGISGQAYEARNRITTTGGRTDDRTIRVYIKEK